MTKQSDDAEEENEVWIYKYAPLLRPLLPSLSSLSLSFLNLVQKNFKYRWETSPCMKQQLDTIWRFIFDCDISSSPPPATPLPFFV